MNRYFLTLLTLFSLNAYSMGGNPPPPPEPTHPPVNISSNNDIGHSIDYINQMATKKISVGTKSVGTANDKVFYDGTGREVSFRGFNVSGSVKLVETGFKPFKNAADAKRSFTILKENVGSNVVRFTVAWEGIHTAPDTINQDYLQEIVLQMKEAINNGLYVYIDYHSDLYSRHTFTPDSANTGNGAPRWIVKGGNHGTDRCGIPCLFTWSAYKLSDPAVRSAMRSFWLNDTIVTQAGIRRVQDEFLWQLGETAKYVKNALSKEEYVYVLGFEPLNEPFDGGLKELGLKDYSDFDNRILWPFYKRVRARLTQVGWEDKWVFAEPMVFWSSVTGILAPATGGGYLKEKPGNGYVFSPHFYDQGRQGVNNSSTAKNAAYFENFKWIRDEARFLDLPTMVTEFGMTTGGKGKSDNARIINASYQATEISDTVNNKKDRFADFYTPFVSATQWHWDIYFDRHQEYQNGNPKKLKTKDDAWNGERYSVIKNGGDDYNAQAELVERVYPRRTQGNLLQFSYNAKVLDAWKKALDWTALRVRLPNETKDSILFKNKKFAFVTWQGRNAETPTEIFLPRHIKTQKLLVMTENNIHNKSLSVGNTPANKQDEVLLLKDSSTGGAHKLLVWDDKVGSESNNSVHFALIGEDINMSKKQLIELQTAIKNKLDAQKSPIYLTGSMDKDGYPEEYKPK